MELWTSELLSPLSRIIVQQDRLVSISTTVQYNSIGTNDTGRSSRLFVYNPLPPQLYYCSFLWFKIPRFWYLRINRLYINGKMILNCKLRVGWCIFHITYAIYFSQKGVYTLAKMEKLRQFYIQTLEYNFQTSGNHYGRVIWKYQYISNCESETIGRKAMSRYKAT